MGIEKVRVKTSFKEDLIVTVEVGNKIQEAMINGTEYQDSFIIRTFHRKRSAKKD